MTTNSNWIVEIPREAMTVKDLQDVMPIEVDANAPPYWTEDEFAKFVVKNNCHGKMVYLMDSVSKTYIIAPRGGRRFCAGYACYSFEDRFLRIKKNVVVLQKLVVNPLCRRKGVGAAMLAFVISKLRVNAREPTARLVLPVSIYSSEAHLFLRDGPLGCREVGPNFNPKGIRCLWEESDYFGSGHPAYIFYYERKLQLQETSVISTNEVKL